MCPVRCEARRTSKHCSTSGMRAQWAGTATCAIPTCKTIFETERANARYCSRKCRERARYRRKSEKKRAE